MANTPIGVTFMPSQDNQDQGPQQGALNGPGGDLSAAFKILSLRLPRVLGASSLAPQRLLTSPGSAAFSGQNPSAAVFEALLKAMTGGGSFGQANALGQPTAGRIGTPGSAGGGDATPPTDGGTRVIPGGAQPRPDPVWGTTDPTPSAPSGFGASPVRDPWSRRV